MLTSWEYTFGGHLDTRDGRRVCQCVAAWAVSASLSDQRLQAFDPPTGRHSARAGALLEIIGRCRDEIG